MSDYTRVYAGGIVKNRLSNAMNRNTQTMTQSNQQVFRHGRVSGTTITFGFKFIGEPDIMLTPCQATGGGTCSQVSINADEDGYFTTATIELSADYVTWYAIGSGIEVPPA